MLIFPELEPISIQVSDRVDGLTVLHQFVHSHQFTVTDQPDRSVVVNCMLRVTPHAVATDGSTGTANPFGYGDRFIPLVADNDTAVSPTTGELRYQSKVRDHSCTDLRTGEVIEFGPDQSFRAFLHADPDALMLQGFLFALMRTEPVKMRDQMLLNIQQADAFGKFA